jgi:hypothetical protein
VGALGAAPSNPPGWKRSKGTKLSARFVAHLIFSLLIIPFLYYSYLIILSDLIKFSNYCISVLYVTYNQIIEIFF